MQTHSSNDCTITLKINLKAELPDNEHLFITGNLPDLGDWDPAGKILQESSPDHYSVKFNTPKDSIVECKVTRGSWRTQGIYNLADIPPNNLIIKANKNKEVKVEILDWLDKQVLESDPVKGRLLEYDEFSCKGLKYKRPIQVWLPDSYTEKGSPAAVIYMHDGQNLFEPASSFAGADWKVDETITKMLKQGELRQCIVVGIPNSPDRMQELNLFTKEGKAYANFVVNEVKPFIEKKFNVSKLACDNAIMGSSMGGLMSFQMVCAFSDIFGMAGCLSSAFQKTYSQIFSQTTKIALPLQAKIYLDTGEYEPSIADSYFTMMKLLLKRGFIEGQNLMGYFDEKATHCEAAWANRLSIPLRFMLGKN